MDCQRTDELLGALVDGELPLDLARLVLEHLRGCVDCREQADSLRSLGAAIRGLGGGAPEGLGARILLGAREAGEAPLPVLEQLHQLWPKVATMLVGAAAMTVFVFPPAQPAMPAPSDPQPRFQLLMVESRADLELAGSFVQDIRRLAGRPESRLMFDLSGGR